MFLSYCEDFAGIEPHWTLFCRCSGVLPQLDQKVIGSLWIKAVDKSLFFQIDIPSNAQIG
jgi:hypothetical protein